MPRGHEHDLIYSLRFTRTFSVQFFFKFSQKKIVMGKKDRCAVFGLNNDHLFPQKYTLYKARVNTERVPPGHPIILLKSNNFNVAAVSVKRSIDTNALRTGITFFNVCCQKCHQACECCHLLASCISLRTTKRVYSKKTKLSDKFDHNFNELYVDSDQPNDFQCIKLRSVQMI